MYSGESIIPDDKKHKILVTARNHLYETSGPYIRELLNKTFQDYVWNVRFAKDMNLTEDCMWHWIMKNNITAGYELSITWYRRNEDYIRKIGIELIKALEKIVTNR